MTISRVSKDCMPCHRHIKKWAWTRSILWKHFYCTTSGGARRAPWRPKRPKQASRSLSRVFCRSDVTQNIISKDSQISKYCLMISISNKFPPFAAFFLHSLLGQKVVYIWAGKIASQWFNFLIDDLNDLDFWFLKLVWTWRLNQYICINWISTDWFSTLIRDKVLGRIIIWNLWQYKLPIQNINFLFLLIVQFNKTRDWDWFIAITFTKATVTILGQSLN